MIHSEAVKKYEETLEAEDRRYDKENTYDLLDTDMVYDFLSIPSCTYSEGMMADAIMAYCQGKGWECHGDLTGNVYVTKGTVKPGECYPCMCAHIDTVHHSQRTMVEAQERLPLKTRVGESGHYEVICCGPGGVGGDDKCGVIIALSVLERADAMKAAFFMGEEIGCVGSRELDPDWFADVAYCISFDAPGNNWITETCTGVYIHTPEAMAKIESLLKDYGYTSLSHDPYTDVEQVAQLALVNCFNFGASYYNYHSQYEYCDLHDMNRCVSLGLKLIDTLGRTRLPMTENDLSRGRTNLWSLSIEDYERYLRGELLK